MNHERAMELLAEIAEDTSQPAYARVNALRALLDHASADEEPDKRAVASARRLMRKIDGDKKAA
jgi:hypothetical protein